MSQRVRPFDGAGAGDEIEVVLGRPLDTVATCTVVVLDGDPGDEGILRRLEAEPSSGAHDRLVLEVIGGRNGPKVRGCLDDPERTSGVERVRVLS